MTTDQFKADLPALGRVRMRESLRLPGAYLLGLCLRIADHWYVSTTIGTLEKRFPLHLKTRALRQA